MNPQLRVVWDHYDALMIHLEFIKWQFSSVLIRLKRIIHSFFLFSAPPSAACRGLLSDVELVNGGTHGSNKKLLQ